ncbi:MAG: FAD-dependent oxidoreductase [Proteobacteria bacterium]|nr:FAD-dependent oxidoreductase [Pseudomonadota bacterium]NBP14501.1 FAD-dependent oxidoreductase [bacterium]
MSLPNKRVAVVGGGIGGVFTAIQLAKRQNTKVDVYEKNNGILQGPPYCHLHAGGFLYPEISTLDSQALFYHAAMFAEYFPDAIVRRPCIIAYNKHSQYHTHDLLHKCKVIKYLYNCWHGLHGSTPFGPIDNFYCVYSKDDVIHYKENGHMTSNDSPANKFHDQYASAFCELIDDIDSIKYPFVSVCEFTIDQAAVEFQLVNEFYKSDSITLHKNTFVQDLKGQLQSHYDVVIDCTGRGSPIESQSESPIVAEYKSSWLVECPRGANFPEIAIIGERGTYNGTLQITPVGTHTCQVHYMSHESTIIKEYTYGDDLIPLSNETLRTRAKIAMDRVKNFSKHFFDIFEIHSTRNTGGIQRVVENSAENRVSSVYLGENGIVHVKLVKAMSVVYLFKQIARKV